MLALGNLFPIVGSYGYMPPDILRLSCSDYFLFSSHLEEYDVFSMDTWAAAIVYTEIRLGVFAPASMSQALDVNRWLYDDWINRIKRDLPTNEAAFILSLLERAPRSRLKNVTDIVAKDFFKSTHAHCPPNIQQLYTIS